MHLTYAMTHGRDRLRPAGATLCRQSCMAASRQAGNTRKAMCQWSPGCCFISHSLALPTHPAVTSHPMYCPQAHPFCLLTWLPLDMHLFSFSLKGAPACAGLLCRQTCQAAAQLGNSRRQCGTTSFVAVDAAENSQRKSGYNCGRISFGANKEGFGEELAVHDVSSGSDCMRRPRRWPPRQDALRRSSRWSATWSSPSRSVVFGHR